MKRSVSVFTTAASFFAILGILFIPFPFSLSSIQLRITDFLFGRLIGFAGKALTGHTLKQTKVYSDSVSMYILLLVLLLLAVFISILINNTKRWQWYGQKAIAVIYTICCYYLLLQMLKYGVGKIFKDQFYLPEPNTLYTPMGRLGKDILFWSAVGTSYTYNIIMGLVEILAALLLLFRKTRTAGLLLTVVVMLQVLVINFSFDISVKLYSFFLLYICTYLLAPYLKRLYQATFTNATNLSSPAAPAIRISKPFFQTAGKYIVTGLILMEALYPYIQSGNFNDDLAPRPLLHGAYEVKEVIRGADTLTISQSPVKKFFFHRDGYIIFQNNEDEMQDYKVSVDKSGEALILEDYQLRKTVLPFHYSSVDSVLTLQFVRNDTSYQLRGKALNWRNLPVLKNEFHWVIDGDGL